MKRYRVVVLLALAAAISPMLALAQDTGEGASTPIDAMSDYALFSIVGGALTSVVTATINRQRWQSTTKLLCFFLLCCVTAAGNAYFTRTLDFANWSRSLLLVVASGWVTYQAAKPAIKELETKTG